jgi:hypothetical protein
MELSLSVAGGFEEVQLVKTYLKILAAAISVAALWFGNAILNTRAFMR